MNIIYQETPNFFLLFFKLYIATPTNLHSNREVRTGLWREKHIDGFLLERLVISCWSTHFNHMEL